MNLYQITDGSKKTKILAGSTQKAVSVYCVQFRSQPTGSLQIDLLKLNADIPDEEQYSHVVL